MKTSLPQPAHIVRITDESPSVRTLVLDIHLEAGPGQFVMAWIPDIDEKPFSLVSAAPVSLTIARVGPFSSCIHALGPGDRLWIRGPLGKPFQLPPMLPPGGALLLVGGGYGVAPLYFLAQRALSAGWITCMIIGARTASDIIFADRFRSLGATVTITTDDGSLGQRGVATNAAVQILDQIDFQAVYACGPEPMLDAIAELIRDHALPAQLSYEQYMRCGFGICGSCTREGWLVCHDGPVKKSVKNSTFGRNTEPMDYTLVHLSDIHYGPPFQYQLEPILLQEIKDLTPDMAILSGDLTQRARKRQFEQAKAFLDRLPKPYLVIPGNHDVPLYNVFDRLFRSLTRYKRYIRPEVDMTVRAGGLLAVGLNSAYGWTNDRGRLTKSQLEMAQQMFTQASDTDLKILVTHHHFVCPPGVHQGSLPEELLSRFSGWGVELVLTGHTHLTHIEQRPDGLVLLQSGTATATRWKKLKKRVNSFNVISVTPDQISIQVHEYEQDQQTYSPLDTYAFSRNVR